MGAKREGDAMANDKPLHQLNHKRGASFPLTVFERYLLAEDRPNYPCWIIVKFHFNGVFKRAETQSALDQAIDRNPLLHAVLRRGFCGNLRWEVLSDWKPQIQWLKGPLPNAWPDWEPMDLFKEPGFRLFAIEYPDKTEWIFHVHHAICDGKALRDVFYDIMNHYAIAMGQPVALSPLRPEIFPQRNRLASNWRDRLKTLPSQFIGLSLTHRLQKKQIAPLSQNTIGEILSGRATSYPALVSRRLSEECFRKVRDEAMRQKVTSNDIFLRDLFHSLKLWRDWKLEGDPMDWLRVVLPVDMRKPVDRFLSAANVTSIVTLDRRMNSLADRQNFLPQIHDDMNWVKHRGLRFTFWTLLKLRRFLHKGIERYSHRPSCQGTIIFANHCQLMTRSPLLNKKRMIEVPGVLLEDLTMVSPIRPGTMAALVVGTYAGRVLIDLHYDPNFITQSQADKLLDIFLAQFDSYASNITGKMPPSDVALEGSVKPAC